MPSTRHRPSRHRLLNRGLLRAMALATALVASTFGLAVGRAQAQPAGGMDRAATIRLAASILRIEAPRPRGGFSLGSGVMVGPDLVITNCHVTRESGSLFVVRGGVRWPVKAQLADLPHDLCLLQTTNALAPIAPLADSALQIGQNVTALGYTGGVDLQHSFGEVVNLHRLDGASVVQTSNGFNSGASGGGLFDGDGRLVGILTFRMSGGAQHFFAAPARWVQKLLDDARAGGLQAVAPLDPAQMPYWQQPGDQQPKFLRASRMVREQRWRDLAALSHAWLNDDQRDGEPWRLLGLALDKLAQPQAARVAYDCADRLQAAQPTGIPGAPAPAPADAAPSAATVANDHAAISTPACPADT